MISKMKWPEKSGSGPVTIAYLQERRVLLRWQEVVALGLEAAEVFERSGKRSLPREQNLELTQGGTVKILRGRTHSGDPVTALARTLNSILPEDRPTQLRLVLSTAGPDSGSAKSMSEFLEALKYFERPGRRAVLAEVCQRALETPVPVDAPEVEPEPTYDKTPTQRRPRWVMPTVATLGLAAVGLASVSVVEQASPGAITGRVEAVRVAASTAWNRVVDETAWMREAAAEDLSQVVDKVKEVTDDVRDAANERIGGDEGTTSDEDSNDGSPSASSSAVARPQPLVWARADQSAPAAAEKGVPDSAVNEAAANVAELGGEGTGEGAGWVPENDTENLMAAVVFDSGHVNVTPPVTLRLQLPAVSERTPWRENNGVVEAVVSAAGEVERVRLVSPPESIHQSMILSAIKTWRFRPAEKDGVAVRYRHLIPVAIPH